MKGFQKAIRTVALAISPLFLSFVTIVLLYALLANTLTPIFSIANLFLFAEEQDDAEKNYENIFQGYEEKEDSLQKQEMIDGNTIVYPKRGALYAKLLIKSVGMETDVYFDDSDAALSRGGVGQSYSSKIPGYGKPILISGHNNGKFNALQHVSVGDIVTITTNYGIYEYRIRECVVKDKDDPGAVELNKEEEELILYTCYPFTMLGLTRQRYFVYADKISGPVVMY